MALAKAVATDRVRLLGWSEPYEYEAGTMGKTTFPAGVSMKVCVGNAEHDFEVLKVKTAEVFEVVKVVSKMALLDEMEITYNSGQSGQPGRLLSCKALQLAAPVKS